MAKSDTLYKDSPALKRDDKGKVGVEKPSEADGENMGIEGNPLPGSEGKMPIQASERREMKHKHVTEHLAQHHRQETEHENHAEGDKKELHKKHEAEHKEMTERHHEEFRAMHKRHNKGEAPKKEASGEGKSGGAEVASVDSTE